MAIFHLAELLAACSGERRACVTSRHVYREAPLPMRKFTRRLLGEKVQANPILPLIESERHHGMPKNKKACSSTYATWVTLLVLALVKSSPTLIILCAEEKTQTGQAGPHRN